MDCEFHHVFPTWEIYPRVHYFKSRYLDLHVRFKRIIGALPGRFHDKALVSSLENLARFLEKLVQVLVIGHEDIPPGRLIVSTEALEQYKNVPLLDTNDFHIFICHAKITDLSETGLQEIRYVLDIFRRNYQEKCSFLSTVFVVCETRSIYSETDLEHFRSNILKIMKTPTEHLCCETEVLVGPTESDLPLKISKALEKQIIIGFNEIFSFLQKFIRKDFRTNNEDIDVLKSDVVVQAMQHFLRNAHSFTDTIAVEKPSTLTDLILSTLSGKIMLASVSPLAVKHNLPDHVCHGLLDEIKLDIDLKKFISNNATHHLKKFEEDVQRLIEQKKDGKAVEGTQQKSHFDFIVYVLQKDLAEPVSEAEKKLTAMNRLSTVMRKMAFEIRGYFKQSEVDVEIADIGQRELTLKDITNKMQEEIISTEGVYGMGTLYGQLEIHLKMDLKDINETKNKIAEIMKNHRFLYPYITKNVEHGLQNLAGNFYETGEKLLSPFPDNEEEIRVGTLGCFIKSNDGTLYAVTCAHVVDPYKNEKHYVYIKSEGNKFAISSPAMLLCDHKEVPLIDFAAIKVLPNQTDKCSFYLRDEFGRNKKGRLASESSKELVGSFVFKYGAFTGFTQGIISSNSYICNEQDATHEQVVLVDSLPAGSDEKTVIPNNRNSSPVSPQTSNVFMEGAGIDTEGGDITDVLREKTTDDQPMNSTINSVEQSPVGIVCVSMTEADNSCPNSKGQTLTPMPEADDTPDNTEINPVGSDEVLSRSSSVISCDGITHFAIQGDSGSMVCMRDLRNNQIIAVSMVTSGHLRLKDPLKQEDGSEKCLSVRIDKTLPLLGERCGTEFIFC